MDAYAAARAIRQRAEQLMQELIDRNKGDERLMDRLQQATQASRRRAAASARLWNRPRRNPMARVRTSPRKVRSSGGKKAPAEAMLLEGC